MDALPNLEVHPWDAVFPVIAFGLVIVIPSFIAVWAIVKTLREKDPIEGEDPHV